MTIKDIAKKAEVSTASVSRVINNAPNVSEELRKKVMSLIDEVGYKPNSIGKQLRTSKSEKILVVLPTLSNPFYATIIKGIEEECSELNYGVLIAVINLNNELERKYIELLTTKQVDGIISFFSTLAPDEINKMAEAFPYVQCCEPTENTSTSSVSINNKKAAYDAVSYLTSCGHKRIGMISGYYFKTSEREREAGFKEALEKADIAFSEELIVKSDYDYEGGQKACKKLFDLENPPTAIFAVSDTIAIGAMKYLSTINKIVGKDVDIVGFDNATVSKMSSPTVSTVSQPRLELGQTAVSLLMDKIHNSSSINKSVVLPHKLIFRESTGIKFK